MVIPAKKFDIIKKVGNHYVSEFTNGEHFVVIDVLNGDDTAVVLKPDGTLGTLCYPEEYEVVTTADELLNKLHDESVKLTINLDEFKPRTKFFDNKK